MTRVILLVDDIKTNREILKKILCDEYTLLEAADGQEALSIMAREYQHLSAVLLDLGMPVLDGFEVLAQMRESETLSQLPVIVTTGQTEETSEVKALQLGANDYITKPYNSVIIKQRIHNTIKLRETAIAVNELQRDRLTGLYSRTTFFEKVRELVSHRPAGSFLMSCVNIDSFKVVNDQYGTEIGDAVLRHVAVCLAESVAELDGLCCRVMADSFAILTPLPAPSEGWVAAYHQQAMHPPFLSHPIRLRIGRCLVDDLALSPSALYDRAVLAEQTLKGRYDQYIADYQRSMLDRLLHEQKIVMEMDAALSSGQFEPWFQPQYNHATGALVGAEALVRWRRPDGSIVTPDQFIPVFERNGFIYELDKYIWERVCCLLSRWLQEGRRPLPVSVNISRIDLLRLDCCSVLVGLVERYGLPVSLLRLEVTESAFVGSGSRIIEMVRSLAEYGFTIEIDDFGSGYSSLNTLKEVPADIIKLDMKFLQMGSDSQRGGNIIESVVRMTKWLGMAVIAEGVEDVYQADFLKSIGCNYVQGYLYAKPLPLSEYEALARQMRKESGMVTLETLTSLDNDAFWDPSSLDTLVFNNFVGAACVFEFYRESLELLRVNDNYAREMGVTYQAGDSFAPLEPVPYLDAENQSRLLDNIHKALASGGRETCRLKLTGINNSPQPTYLLSTLRLIARVGERCLFYCSIHNVTEEMKLRDELRQAQQELRLLLAGQSVTAV